MGINEFIEGITRVDELIEGIGKLGSKYRRRGDLLRFAKAEIEHHLETGMLYLGFYEDTKKRRGPDACLLEVALDSYRIFHALYKLSKSKGGFTKELDINIEAGIRASLDSINEGYLGLQEKINGVTMINYHDLEIMERLKDSALALVRTFPEEPEYKQVVERCYHRLMAETLVRGHAENNAAYFEMNRLYFIGLCQFRGIDPENPPKA